MACDAELTGPARRALPAIAPRIVPAIIEFAYRDLARDPAASASSSNASWLACFGARGGPYRLLYRIDDETRRVYIVAIDHRADVYRPR